jgi:hypothetical protein
MTQQTSKESAARSPFWRNCITPMSYNSTKYHLGNTDHRNVRWNPPNHGVRRGRITFWIHRQKEKTLVIISYHLVPATNIRSLVHPQERNSPSGFKTWEFTARSKQKYQNSRLWLIQLVPLRPKTQNCLWISFLRSSLNDLRTEVLMSWSRYLVKWSYSIRHAEWFSSFLRYKYL